VAKLPRKISGKDLLKVRKGFPVKMIEIITGKRTQAEIPAKIARRVQDLATAETPFSTGFRVHKQLRALAQAHALYRADAKVKMEDFEEIKRLSEFMNLGFHQI
jgi:predicted metallopeptidase